MSDASSVHHLVVPEPASEGPFQMHSIALAMERHGSMLEGHIGEMNHAEFCRYCRRRRAAFLALSLLVVQLINLIFFIAPNIPFMVCLCCDTGFRDNLEVAAAIIRWSCWNLVCSASHPLHLMWNKMKEAPLHHIRVLLAE